MPVHRPELNRRRTPSPAYLQASTSPTATTTRFTNRSESYEGSESRPRLRGDWIELSTLPARDLQSEVIEVSGRSQAEAKTPSPTPKFSECSHNQPDRRPSQLLESILLDDVHTAPQIIRAQVERSWAQLSLDQLTSSCKQYLMNCFWTRHNSIFHAVNQKAFLSGMHNGNKQTYSLFLHLAILAVGFSYADLGRPETQELCTGANGYKVSSLHQECRLLVELELEGEPTIAFAQAMLLMAELEMNHGTRYLDCLLIGETATNFKDLLQS